MVTHIKKIDEMDDNMKCKECKKTDKKDSTYTAKYLFEHLHYCLQV